MPKPVNTYRLTVDYYKYPKHGTSGGYDVGASSPQEAVDLLKKVIGFGSIQVLYGYTIDDEHVVLLSGKTAKTCGTRKIRMYHVDDPGKMLERNQIVKVGGGSVRHDCDPKEPESMPENAVAKRSMECGHDRYKAMV